MVAHPKLINLPAGQSMEEFLAPLVEAGLGGLECWYSEHSPQETEAFLALAGRFGLVATGGSDYHGGNKPHLKLGVGRGELRVPLRAAEELEARAAIH